MKTFNLTKLVGMIILLIALSLNSIGQTNTQLDPSSNPPNGLLASKVPQFVVIGWDDNDSEAGINWILGFTKSLVNPAGTGNPATYDGAPVRNSFYNSSFYITTGGADGPDQIKWAWNKMATDGHEVGNHTNSHSEALKTMDATGWENEISLCNTYQSQALPPTPPYWMSTPNTGAGIDVSKIKGFRTPFLAYGGPVFPTLKKLGFVYDCSIEEGNQADQNGTNFYWPYTFDNSSKSGHYASWLGNPTNPDHFDISDVPGLWELPNHIVMVPDDATCTTKGYPTGIRAKMVAATTVNGTSWFVDKMTGFDYNLWTQIGLTRAEVTAILKYNLDLRYAGNRAPFMFGAHTGNYIAAYDGNCKGAGWADRRGAIEDFINYALLKSDVRVVSGIDIIKWMQNPVALGAAVGPFSLTTNATNGTIAKTPSASTYDNGTVVTLTATPANGYKFDSWSGDASGTSTSTTVTMNDNKTVTANFSLIGTTTYTLTTNATNGTITKNPNQTIFNAGESVILTATAANGYTFNSWSGDATGTTSSVTITMNSNKNVTATFDQNQLVGCSDYINMMSSGSFIGYIDEYGSTITIDSSSLPLSISTTWTQVKMPDSITWPWIDFSMSLPNDLKMTGACSVEITYKSDNNLILSLPQPPLSNDGISYLISLPASTILSTIKADINTFAQPSWIEPAQAATLNLDSVSGLSIAPDITTDLAAISGSFEITTLKIYGIIVTDITKTVDQSINMVYLNKNSLTITGAEEGRYQVQVLSVDGRLMHATTLELNTSKTTISLDNTLSNGVYFVRITGNNTATFKKIVLN